MSWIDQVLPLSCVLPDQYVTFNTPVVVSDCSSTNRSHVVDLLAVLVVVVLNVRIHVVTEHRQADESADDARKRLGHLRLFRDQARLDRDLARFMTIQAYGEKTIHAADHDEFFQISVESIIEAFEVECSAILTYDKKGSSLEVLAAFGFEDLETGSKLKIDWLRAKGHLKGKNDTTNQSLRAIARNRA